MLDSWQKQLDTSGPGVHNVTFEVNDLENVRVAMLNRGARQLAQFDADMSRAGLDVDQPTRVYVMDAREQSGLRFEMMEPLTNR